MAEIVKITNNPPLRALASGGLLDGFRFWSAIGRRCLLCALLLLGVAPGGPAQAAADPADAQDPDFEQRLRQAEAELDAAARKLRDVYQERFRSKDRPRKAMLGVLVEYDKSDNGVQLTGLTPGGGAEAAGLRARDVLVSINGTRLDDANDGRSSMKALNELMAQVVPGDGVVVGYRRGSEEALTTVTTRAHQKDLNALLESMDIDVDIDFSDLGDEIAEAAESVAMSALALVTRTPGAPEPPQTQQVPAPPAPQAPKPATDAAERLQHLAALTEGLTVSATPDRFIDMDPDLAAYFGVDQGVLAVGMDASADGLKSGDVLLSLGGESMASAATALAVLNAAEGTIEAEVLRQGATRVLQLDGERYRPARRVSVIRISQDGEDVEVSIDSGEDDDG